MTPKVFIDGEAGTTGLQLRARLEGRSDIEFIRLDETERKNRARREAALNECDLAILCLPDDAAREAAALVHNPRVKLLDASSAHRVAPGWVYGLPELAPGQAQAIAEGTRVSNPGCYPTGVILLLKPLIRAGWLPADFAASVHAVSGYSGGGKSLIEKFERAQQSQRSPYNWYALKLEHKHIEEMRRYSELAYRPIFMPSYGNYRQGIVLQIPLQLRALARAASGDELRAALAEYYRDAQYVRVVPGGEAAALETLEPERLNGTNRIELYVFANDRERQAVLAAVYDNLGKGASGAAVQNLNLMLGLRETGNLDLSRRATSSA